MKGIFGKFKHMQCVSFECSNLGKDGREVVVVETYN